MSGIAAGSQGRYRSFRDNIIRQIHSRIEINIRAELIAEYEVRLRNANRWQLFWIKRELEFAVEDRLLGVLETESVKQAIETALELHHYPDPSPESMW